MFDAIIRILELHIRLTLPAALRKPSECIPPQAKSHLDYDFFQVHSNEVRALLLVIRADYWQEKEISFCLGTAWWYCISFVWSRWEALRSLRGMRLSLIYKLMSINFLTSGINIRMNALIKALLSADSLKCLAIYRKLGGIYSAGSNHYVYWVLHCTKIGSRLCGLLNLHLLSQSCYD